MEQLNGGFINQAFKKENQVVKHYKECPTVFVPIRQRFENEVRSLRFFGGQYAPLLYHADEQELKVTMEFLPGESMKHHVDNGLSKYEKDELFEGFGNMLKKIHTIPVDRNISEYITHMRRKALADFTMFEKSGVHRMFGINMDAVKTRIVRVAIPEVTRRAHERGGLSHTHGDIWSNNIIGDKAIDWEFSTVGMPEEDLSQVYMWDISRFPDQQKAFEEGYGQVGDLRSFQLLKLLDYMEGASVEQVEGENEDGFITVHARALREMFNGK